MAHLSFDGEPLIISCINKRKTKGKRKRKLKLKNLMNRTEKIKQRSILFDITLSFLFNLTKEYNKRSYLTQECYCTSYNYNQCNGLQCSRIFMSINYISRATCAAAQKLIEVI